MNRQHNYQLTIEWTGNTGSGTKNYKSYSRDYIIKINNKINIKGSSDPAFMGDVTKHNPEELLLASLSSCHMLWYLHLCSEEGVIITNYTDDAQGTMIETSNGGGSFSQVILYPTVTVKEKEMEEKAMELHKKATKLCFIANSVNFPVNHIPTIVTI